MTSRDVRKTVTLSGEVPETSATTSNISVDISAEQTVKYYSDTVRNHEKFQQIKKKSRVVYGKYSLLRVFLEYIQSTKKRTWRTF